MPGCTRGLKPTQIVLTQGTRAYLSLRLRHKRVGIDDLLSQYMNSFTPYLDIGIAIKLYSFWVFCLSRFIAAG